eukprot:TRINITY_DN49963_c0_g1_i1.p1 TRINITY_DN49963_c0_g1~~TRINITY_DN49963_c0_g1_i1.p1  ORF type:complete len:597 (+),score=142.96 TRINITY_DN49963_c0_g1_i1:77-1867(+)
MSELRSGSASASPEAAPPPELEGCSGGASPAAAAGCGAGWEDADRSLSVPRESPSPRRAPLPAGPDARLRAEGSAAAAASEAFAHLCSAGAAERDAADSWWQLQVALSQGPDARLEADAEEAAEVLRRAERLRLSSESAVRAALGEVHSETADGARLRQRVAELQEDLDDARQRLRESSRSSLPRANGPDAPGGADLAAEVAELRSECEALRTENSRLVKQVQEVGRAAAEAASVSDRVAELELLVESAQRAAADGSLQLAAERQEAGARDALLEQATARAAAAESRVAALEGELARLRQRPAPALPELPPATADSKELEERLMQLEGELQRVQEASMQMQGYGPRLREVERERDQAINALSRVQRERNSLARQLSARLDRLEGEAAMLRVGRPTHPAATPGTPQRACRSPTRAVTSPAHRMPPRRASWGSGKDLCDHQDIAGCAVLGIEVAGPAPGARERQEGVRVAAARRPALPLIQEGDIILKLDGVPTAALADFRAVAQGLKAGVNVQFIIRRKGPGGPMLRTVDIRSRPLRGSSSSRARRSGTPGAGGGSEPPAYSVDSAPSATPPPHDFDLLQHGGPDGVPVSAWTPRYG